MPDKLTSSEPASAAGTEVPQAASAARKIYPIVKYGDPILERAGAPVKKIRRGIGAACRGYVRFDVRAQEWDWRRRKSERACGLRWWT